MLPSFARDNDGDAVLVYPVFFPDGSLRHSSCGILRSDGSNISLGEFGVGVSAASAIRAVPNTISLIGLWRTPAKVAQMVVRAISVVMAALHSRWARADKRLKYKTVDGAVLSGAKHNHLMAKPADGPRSKSLPIAPLNPLASISPAEHYRVPTRPHGAVAADPVAGKAFDITVLDGRIEFRHGPLPLQVVSVQGGWRE